MKLAIFTSQVTPYHNARYVEAEKHFDEVHVVSSVNAGDFPQFLAKTFGEYYLHRLYDGRQAYATATESGELAHYVRSVLNEIQPGAIAVAGWTVPESFAALDYARDTNVPIIIMSESQGDDAKRWFWRERIKKSIVSQFDAALVGGPPHAEYVACLGIPRDRIHFGYNAVDNIYFERGAHFARQHGDQLRAQYGLPRRYVLASARFISKKNLPSLIVAYANARRRLSELPELVLLGDGPARGDLEDLIKSKDAKDVVHLPGFRGYETLPAYYALSEAFVHVSTVEQWGLVINEAMASGVPVIASRTCGAARTLIQDGMTGLLTGVDAGSISDGIVRFFNMTPDQRSCIGLAGATAIREWGPERFGSGIRAAVESAQRGCGRGRISPVKRWILAFLQRKIINSVQ